MANLIDLGRIGSRKVGTKIVEHPISGETTEENVYFRDLVMPGVHDLGSPQSLIDSLGVHRDSVLEHLNDLNGTATPLERERLGNYMGCLDGAIDVIGREYRVR